MSSRPFVSYNFGMVHALAIVLCWSVIVLAAIRTIPAIASIQMGDPIHTAEELFVPVVTAAVAMCALVWLG